MEDVNVSAAMIPYFITEKDVVWVGENRISAYYLVNRKMKEVYTANDDSEN
ncbi:hypothetical protein [Chryseobacterium carnipullorum]|uniref:Uncharacterized protein n=1 Tax=Chryseobacterium carnipullorum TaxID=1124835 RepID=A0A376EEM7_CHRCU|nr:hypothetical protein [Chryseobacterium carnipullorum]STD07898.1 Uncharacterised protein [Chryseobacterium carnipullorum]